MLRCFDFSVSISAIMQSEYVALTMNSVTLIMLITEAQRHHKQKDIPVMNTHKNLQRKTENGKRNKPRKIRNITKN